METERKFRCEGGGASMGDDPADDPAGEEGPCAAVALRLVAAASWHVVRARRFPDFPRVLAFLESVAAVAPELVPFQHLAKLRLGLQAKIVMTMLQEEQPHGKIYEAIDTYFPENEAPSLHHSKATPQDLEQVQTATENFRVLVLMLLSDGKTKERYLQARPEYLEEDYGEDFMNVVENLLRDYLCQLEHVLPEPEVPRLLEAASLQDPSQLPQLSATVLNQYFSAVGYQRAGCAEPPVSPSRSSCASPQSEDTEPCSPWLSPQPGGSRNEETPSPVSEWDLLNPPGFAQSSETPEDLVPDSESERSTSPSQGEYQGTRLCTLIPTFQEHLRESISQLNSSPPFRLASPEV